MARTPVCTSDVLALLDKTGALTARAVAGVFSVSVSEAQSLLAHAQTDRLVARIGAMGAFGLTDRGRRMLRRPGGAPQGG